MQSEYGEPREKEKSKINPGGTEIIKVRRSGFPGIVSS